MQSNSNSKPKSKILQLIIVILIIMSAILILITTIGIVCFSYKRKEITSDDINTEHQKTEQITDFNNNNGIVIYETPEDESVDASDIIEYEKEELEQQQQEETEQQQSEQEQEQETQDVQQEEPPKQETPKEEFTFEWDEGSSDDFYEDVEDIGEGGGAEYSDYDGNLRF